MATSNKDFKIKNGLIVEGDSATVNGNEVLTSASSIDDLDDVSITTPADTQVLAYEAATSLWKNVNFSGGSSVIVSATAPTDPEPTEGNQWFDSSTGTTYIYYDDFWVPVSPPKAGPTGATGATGDPGVVISESAPESTDVIWLDSDEESQAPVPTGGTTGQVLAKASSTDYDTEWSTLNAADISDITASVAALNSTSSATSGLTALSNGTNGITYQPVSYNAIINGAFDIWQRGTSFTGTGYTADRWNGNWNGTGARVISRETFSPGTAPVAGYEGQFFCRFNQTTAGTGGTFSNFTEQKIEDVRTLAGQTATLSFFAKADSNRTITSIFSHTFGSGGSSTIFFGSTSHSLTTAWQRFTVTLQIPSLAGKTIGAGNFLAVIFTNVALNTAQTIDLWGVQLEAGAVATPFKRNAPSIQAELAACQRYYVRYPGIGGVTELGPVAVYSTTNANARIFTPVPMRVFPTGVEFSNLNVVDTALGVFAISSVTLNNGSANSVGLNLGISGATQHRPGWFRTADATGFLGFSAEL